MEPTHQIVLRKDMTPAELNDVFALVKSLLPVPIKKLGIRELSLFAPKKDEEDMASVIRNVLHSADEESMLQLWNECKKNLQHKIILSIDTRVEEVALETTLLQKLDLGGDFVARAFLSHYAFKRPTQSPYSTRYGEVSPEVAERLALLLDKLPLISAREMVTRMGAPMLYLLISEEIEGYLEDRGYTLKQIEDFFCNISDEEPFDFHALCEAGAELYASIHAGMSVPLELHFTAWLQHNLPDLFRLIITEVFNPNWSEVRNMYYEVHNRNVKAVEKDPEPTVDENEAFIKKHLKD